MPHAIMSWHDWQSDTSKCSRSRLDHMTYWNSRILISGNPRAARYHHSKSYYAAGGSDSLHSFVPGHKRYPERQVNLTVSKNSNSSYTPTQQAVQRQADLMGSESDIIDRMQAMVRSSMTAAASVRASVQDDQKKGHNPFIVKIDFQIDHGRMIETTVKITNCLSYKRKNMDLQATTPGIVPFNWIATIPLCFAKYPVVEFVINNKKHTHEVLTGNFETKELKLGETYMVGVTFVDTFLKDNYFASMKTALLVCNDAADGLGRLENVLNVSYLKNPKQIHADCTSVLKIFDICDILLSNYDILHKTELGKCYLDKNSSILDDMSCAKDTTHDPGGSQIHGNISREDVVEAIDFDKICFLQQDRYDESEISYQKNVQLYNVIDQLGSVVLPLLQLLAQLHKYKTLKVLGENVYNLIQIRSKMMQKMMSPQMTLSQVHEWPIVIATMKCIDNCILLNIDALCGTKTHLHGICLFASSVRNYANTTPLSKFCKQLSQEAMQFRTDFDHKNVFGKTLQMFAYKRTSVCRQMWKWTVCSSVNHYFQNEMVPNHLKKYYGTIHQPQIFQFIFLPESLELYQETIDREKLRTILDTQIQLSDKQKTSIMSYATVPALKQLKIEQEFKAYLLSNSLVLDLMTFSKYTDSATTARIDAAWSKLCQQSHT